MAYAVATTVFLPATGLSTGRWSLLVTVAWIAFVVATGVYARRQSVLRRGARRLYLGATLVWALLWVSAVVVGHSAFSGRPSYWVPAGLAASVPLLLGARLAIRR